jgi:hypothetical protein
MNICTRHKFTIAKRSEAVLTTTCTKSFKGTKTIQLTSNPHSWCICIQTPTAALRVCLPWFMDSKNFNVTVLKENMPQMNRQLTLHGTKQT